MKTYDIAIIGAGPGGYVCAIRAAQLGLKTALIEKDAIGGTCLNRGCIPTKTLMHAANLYKEMKQASAYGLSANSTNFDIYKVNERKEAVTSRLVGGIEGLLKSNGVDVIRGEAFIPQTGIVQVGENQLKAKNIVIATGSSAAKLAIEGAELTNVLTGEEMLMHNDKYYKRLLIIGGGVIGMEMASLYAALDCEVTVLEFADRILPAMDRELAQGLSTSLKKRDVRIYTKAVAERIKQEGSMLKCTFTHKDREESLTFDGIIVATGRKANIDGIFDGSLGLKLVDGRIAVDESQQTNFDGIYAIGDVCDGGMQLAHLASAQGINAACAAAGYENEMDTTLVPSCLYTDPEIASVGLTAEEAKARGIPFKSGKALMSANAKTVIETEERGFIKIIAHAETDRLLGAQLMCRRATDLIGELATAISAKMTYRDLGCIIHPHPTFSEAIVEALDDIDSWAIHAAPKRK